MSTIHSNNKKQITTWFILTIAVTGTKRGTKRKNLKRIGGGVAVKIVFYSLAHPVCFSLSFPQQHYNGGGEKKKEKKKVGGVGRGNTG